MRNKAFLISGTTLAGTVMLANVLNLLFSAYLGRILTPEEFGIIALINTLLYIGSMFYQALGATAVHEVSRLESRNNNSSLAAFFSSFLRQVLMISIASATVWALVVPFTSNFFNINSPLILYLFTPLLIFYPLVMVGRGYLQGKLFFALTGLLIFLEPAIKLTSAAALLLLNLEAWVYTSIYISAILTGVIAIIIARHYKPKETPSGNYPFPHKFFWAAFLTTVSTISYLALDMVLVKHYLPPLEAGQYALLTLLGKIIYFSGTILNIFTISIVSRETTHKANPFISFYWLFAGSIALCSVGIITLGFFGNFFIPILFGERANPIIPYALPYVSAIALFTLGSIVVTYHLARKEYLFPYISLGMALILTLGITLYHQTLTQIIYVLFIVGFLYSLSLVLIHIRLNFFAPKVAIKSLETREEIY